MGLISRRELLAGLVGGSAGLLAGCEGKSLPPAGEILSPNLTVGHRLRDGVVPRRAPARRQETDVVVIGGGISGLAAGWRLENAGLEKFLVLELESLAGGTSRSGRSPVTAYPWGAHYVPVPMPENRSLVALLREMGVIAGLDNAGAPVVAEEFLCRDPSERLFVDGRWIDGLYPSEGASERDLDEWRQFRGEIKRWAAWRDAAGRRAFAIPVAAGSDDAAVTALDRLSMADWLRQRGWTSPRLTWLVDYACRDDYGTTCEETSAWAGVFYFSSRLHSPNQEPQQLITWPEGNGRIVAHLSDRVGNRLRLGVAVAEITAAPSDGRADGVEITAIDVRTDEIVGYRAKRAVFAAPQFLVPHLVRGLPDERRKAAAAFEYAPWLVANLHLSGRPVESGFPLSWDNVLYGSRSLGYVTATHQSGRDYGPTVFTWYAPFCDAPAAEARRRLLDLEWSAAAEIVLRDLERAHPDLRPLVERLDVMKWGHAMIRPRTGFVWSAHRLRAAAPIGPIHFAGTDLSGVALCEEAVYHGVRAAEEALRGLGRSVDSIL